METMSSSSPFSAREFCNYEEYSMEQSFMLSDNLKDLKNLRSQLYSAAEYFEVSYTNDDQKQTVVNTLKDYTINALVNTVDHLGSVTYKVNDLMEEKVDEVSGTELRVACIEQRLRTCQECIDRGGLSQQSLVMTAPKYHKRYILPVEGTVHGVEHNVLKSQGCNFDDEDNRKHVMNAVQTMIRGTQPSTLRRGRSPSPSPQPLARPGSFSFIDKVNPENTDKQKVSEKRMSSPLRSKFPLLRSGSLSSRPSTPHSSRPTTPSTSRPTTPIQSRPTTPIPSRPTTPNPFNRRPQYRSDTRKPSSIHLHAEWDDKKDIEQQPSKSKRLFKALLSRRKSKHDEMLYTFLDEY
ncbi:Abil2 [Thalictrum thalictroides]|uniref:Abil2 n=1 Tax=Thalictrum thalictroides TaxID=46969 RepID=A0A7J6WPH9_THATH|nr:Abil2 [Thalictrum thalictroides]